MVPTIETTYTRFSCCAIDSIAPSSVHRNSASLILPEHLPIVRAEGKENRWFRHIIQELGKDHAVIQHKAAGIMTEIGRGGWPGQADVPEQFSIRGSQRIHLFLPSGVDHVCLHGDHSRHGELLLYHVA